MIKPAQLYAEELKKFNMKGELINGICYARNK